MNGRIDSETTPEGRIAAVARSLAIQMAQRKKEPDYADYRDALRPFLQRELILARIDEARKSHAASLTVRIAELARQLEEVNRSIPDGHQL